jgi:hypothetical protein
VGFWLVAACVGGVTQDIDVTKYGRDEVSVSDLVKGWEGVLRCVKMLNNELDRTSLFPDYGVLAIVVLLNCATQVSNLAESPL